MPSSGPTATHVGIERIVVVTDATGDRIGHRQGIILCGLWMVAVRLGDRRAYPSPPNGLGATG